MIAMFLFSLVATLLVYSAGRGDKARDPRLTVLVMALMALFPLLWLAMPKVGLLPAPESGPTASPGLEAGMSLWQVAGVFWLILSGFAVTRLLLAVRGLAVWRRKSVPVGQEDGVEIRVLKGLKGPVAAGVLRRVVFVPDAWKDWDRETREIVLAHELAHHRRRDPLWRWIAQVACAVNVWNPLVFWLARRLALQCEHACDAAVLGKGISAEKYARLLCDFSETRAPAGPALAMATRSTLEARVLRVMERPASKRGSAGVAVLIGVALTLAGVLASIGRKEMVEAPVTGEEVEARFAADAFPAGGAAAGDLEAGQGGFAEKP